MQNLLFLFIISCSISINAQNCEYFIDDDKMGNGDLWNKELTSTEFTNLIEVQNSIYFIVQNGDLYVQDYDSELNTEIATLLKNNDFKVNQTIKQIDLFNFDPTLKPIIQYKIAKSCIDKTNVTNFSFFIL